MVIHRSAVDLIACPKDHAPLAPVHVEQSSNEVSSGLLRCPNCEGVYHIEDGIGSFLELPANSVQSAVMEREFRARDQGYTRVFDRKAEQVRLPELDAIRVLLGGCDGEVVLDAGCGRGPMLPAARGAAT